MSGIATAIIGSSIIQAQATSSAATTAAGIQAEASQGAIDESRYQFDRIQEILRPYQEAGEGSLTAQQDLLGLNGPEAQSKAVEMLRSSPQYQTLVGQGEEAILQNASATGGVRGGNVQGALAQFRPQVLSQLIESQFNKLGGITNVGQSAAAGVAGSAQTTGSNIANLMVQQGQAGAGAAIAQGQGVSQIGQSISNAAVLHGMGVF